MGYMNMKKIKIPLCLECKHFYKNECEEFCCKAFPEGIPDKIIEGDVDHKKPYKKDKGIQFEKKPGKSDKK